MNGFTLTCVLFDLDGTLVDTAPDLIVCLNHALTRHDLPTTAYDAVRPLISFGAAAMIEASLKQPASTALKQNILATMLNHYQCNIAQHSVFFPGMPETLSTIEALGLKWGVVTNKQKRFTQPLMTALKLNHRAACIISGDTTANSKPHPEPMLEGCRQAGVKPQDCVYIGDAGHDITAGKSVGMKTLAALYGYLKPDDRPQSWGADGYIDHPGQINSWIKTSLCL
ncbi:MAG: phosphoglycolate phosphatase [Gammaproteobacteria bacterium HGW-Gammaproteobacteria-3]|nr:MAG: phosphoglycolate phosphatase [Gammaproteobacteria bacterium HGW-Gammaproteobacteria-3]